MTHLRRLAGLVVVTGIVVASVASCDSRPASSGQQPPADHPTAKQKEQPAATDTVRIQLGHCFLEPVSFSGEQWNVPLSTQFGWGGGQPDGWLGVGTMTRLGPDRAGYVDRGGATLTFYPLDDPAIARLHDQVCA